MNRIVLDNKIDINIDDNIKIKVEENNIRTIYIDIIKNTSLVIELNNVKADIIINVKANTEAIIYDMVTGTGKIKYTYNLFNHSILNVYKYNDTTNIRNVSIINLNEQYASINYILKTINLTNDKYDIVINHNASLTNSNIINHGVNMKDGKLTFAVSSFIPHHKKGCYANQINRIINLTDNKCMIYPNLYIDEEDVTANHSALLGKFSDEEMFYLSSRGIDNDNALDLLIRGFLCSNIENKEIINKIETKIKTNWR